MINSKIAWPPHPEFLSEVVPEHVVSLLLAGIVERISAPILLWEKRPTNWEWITPITEMIHYPSFCRFLHDKSFEALKISLCDDLRDKLNIIAARCHLDSKERAELIISSPDSPNCGNNWPLCHMGLISIAVPVYISGRKVAVCASGKFTKRGGRATILQKLKEYGLTDLEIEPIKRYIKRIPCKKSNKEIHLFRKRLADQVLTLEQVGNNYLAKIKGEIEFNLMTDLGSMFNLIFSEKGKSLRKTVQPIIERIRDCFNISFVAVFCSFQKGSTVLPLFAHCGLDSKKVIDAHFNWKKAGLPDNEDFDSYKWLGGYSRDDYPNIFLKNGLKGTDRDNFVKATFLLPYLYGNHYRGVILFGQFPHDADIIIKEKNFLSDVGHLLITRILSLVAIQALNENELWRNLMSKLWAHMIRAELNTLMGEVFILDKKLNRTSMPNDRVREDLALNRIKETLKEMKVTTDMTIKTPEAVIKSISSKLDKTEVTKRIYPLSALIDNCVDKNKNSAEKDGLSILSDENNENLPSAEVDIRLMETVFQNIIDNAIKYSQKGRSIRVYSSVDKLAEWATISFENCGNAIGKEDLSRIFELGYRSKLSEDKEGAGLGLFQAKRFIELHGGKIQVTSKPATKDSGVHEYLTTISISIPTIFYTVGRPK